jgi:hypothetical protein
MAGWKTGSRISLGLKMAEKEAEKNSFKDGISVIRLLCVSFIFKKNVS